MGPPLISGGNNQSWESQPRRWVASMGPPLISGGNSGTFRGHTSGTCASMGPPLISGGNRSYSHPSRHRHPRRFNGAAADQRRKLHTPHLAARRDQRFNGAAADQRRKLPTRSILWQGMPSFNGAAADQRRKSRHPGTSCWWLVAASMGPPLISGGNRRRPLRHGHLGWASMGPPLISGGNL